MRTWKDRLLAENSDEALMRRFQSGESEAFETLFSRYTAPLINFAYRFFHSQCEAEDIVQEVFLRLYKGKDRYDARRPFRPWLFSIASRLVIDRLRARKRHQEVALEATIDTRPESRSLIDILPDASFMKPQDIMEKTEMVQQVREALDGLPENQRIAVLLVRFDEMSYVEVAHTMDLSIAAIKSLLFRAKQTLKRILAPMERRELEWIPIFKERTIRPPAKQTSEIALNN